MIKNAKNKSQAVKNKEVKVNKNNLVDEQRKQMLDRRYIKSRGM